MYYVFYLICIVCSHILIDGSHHNLVKEKNRFSFKKEEENVKVMTKLYVIYANCATS